MATKKPSEVELEREEISTKFDEANQTIRALRFENNFLAKKTKKLEAELFQIRAQLERTSSAKLDEMLNLQKSASNQTDLGYDFSSPSIASARGVQGPAKPDPPARNRPDRRSTGGSEPTYGRSWIEKCTTRILRFGSGFQNISSGKPEPTELVIIKK